MRLNTTWCLFRECEPPGSGVGALHSSSGTFLRVTRDGVFFKCWCYRHQSLRRELELTPAFKKICETFIKIHPKMLAAVYQAAAQMHWPSKAVKQTACGEYVVQLPIEVRSRLLFFCRVSLRFERRGAAISPLRRRNNTTPSCRGARARSYAAWLARRAARDGNYGSTTRRCSRSPARSEPKKLPPT